jgi:hypothetical protein
LQRKNQKYVPHHLSTSMESGWALDQVQRKAWIDFDGWRAEVDREISC